MDCVNKYQVIGPKFWNLTSGENNINSAPRWCYEVYDCSACKWNVTAVNCRKDFDNNNQNANTQAVIAEKDAVITFLKKELLKKSYCRQVMKRQYRELKQKYEALKKKCATEHIVAIEPEVKIVRNRCYKCGKELSDSEMQTILLSVPPKYICKDCAEGK